MTKTVKMNETEFNLTVLVCIYVKFDFIIAQSRFRQQLS